MSYVMGLHGQQRDCCFSEGKLVSVLKRPLSLKNGRLLGVAACHRVLDRDRGEIVLWGKRRYGGVDLVVDYCHRRRGCAEDERRGSYHHGSDRHRRDSYFETSTSPQLQLNSHK
jgi:hypothetical protein